MAYREVGMIEVKEVLRQWLEGGGKKTVARRVGVDPKTARNYIAVAEQCGLIDELGRWALREACLAATGPLATLTAPSAPAIAEARVTVTARPTVRPVSESGSTGRRGRSARAGGAGSRSFWRRTCG